jgi:hypothetical protein
LKCQQNLEDISDETKQFCIQDLLEQLFVADPFSLKENIEELLRYNFPKKELLKATTFATNVIAPDQIKNVHPLERWTLMHCAAYVLTQWYKKDKDLRRNGPLPVGHYVPDDCCDTIKFLTELGIAVTVEAYHENWQPHNLYDAFAEDITVTPADVVTRFSQEGDAVREIFYENIIKPDHFLTLKPRSAVRSAVSISYIDFSKKQITDINSGTFAGLGALQKLNLGNNQIKDIDSGTFAGLSALRELYLYSNPITAIDSGTFTGLSVLQKLNLENNKIAAIAPGTFAGLSALQKLYLDNNQIKAINSGTFAGLSALIELNLGKNQIKAIDSGTFAGLSALTRLDLHNNQITAIAAGAFAGLSALRRLDLGNNQITAIASGAFTGLSALQELYLGKNQITAIASGAFTGLSNLKELDLRGNGALRIREPYGYGFQAMKDERPEWFTVRALYEKLPN